MKNQIFVGFKLTSKFTQDEAFLEKACSELQEFVARHTGCMLPREDAIKQLDKILGLARYVQSPSDHVFSIAYCSDDPSDAEIYKQVFRTRSKTEALKHFVATKLSEGDFSDYQVLFIQNDLTHDLYMFGEREGSHDILIREGMVSLIHEHFPLPDHLVRAARALYKKPDVHEDSEEFMRFLRIGQIHRAREFLGLPKITDDQAIALDQANNNSVDKEDVAELMSMVTDFLSSGVELPDGRGVLVLQKSTPDAGDEGADITNPNALNKTLH